MFSSLEKPRCIECNTELNVFAHKFVTNEVHCKAVCPGCFRSRHIPREYLIFAQDQYENGEYKVLKPFRKKILKKRKQVQKEKSSIKNKEQVLNKLIGVNK